MPLCVLPVRVVTVKRSILVGDKEHAVRAAKADKLVVHNFDQKVTVRMDLRGVALDFPWQHKDLFISTKASHEWITRQDTHRPLRIEASARAPCCKEQHVCREKDRASLSRPLG